ncbi:MAG: hypothetical protein AzoDbin1_04226 [Azoarcus sp.]|nr:hypothetical protein [Azoarcus sp.]
MVLIIEEWDVAALMAAPEPPPTPSPPVAKPAKPLENHAARAKVGDLVRYTPFFPEHAADLVTGTIVTAFRGCLGGHGWKIRVVAEDGTTTFVRRYASGGSIMIIRAGAI